MNRVLILPALFLAMLLLDGCSGVSDTRPEVLRSSDRYLQQGVEAYGNSDYVSATAFFSKALAQYRSIDDLNGMLISRINLAETGVAAGAYDAVKRQLEESEQIVTTLGGSSYTPRLKLLWAQNYWREGNREQALEYLQPLLPEFDNADQPRQRLDILQLSAVMLRTDIAFDDIDNNGGEAAQWLRRLNFAFARTSDTSAQHTARKLRFEAQWAMHNGKLAKAEEKFNEALTAYREAATRPAIAATLAESARLAMHQQQLQLAEDRLLRALYIRVWILDRIGSAAVLDQLSAVYSMKRNVGAAEEAAEWARHIRTGGSTDWRELGKTYLQGAMAIP